MALVSHYLARMITARRFVPVLVLSAVACVPGQRATLRPGSDMALPASRPVQVERKNGETCVNVRGATVKGDVISCSPLAPDSTRRPSPVSRPELR